MYSFPDVTGLKLPLVRVRRAGVAQHNRDHRDRASAGALTCKGDVTSITARLVGTQQDENVSAPGLLSIYMRYVSTPMR